MTAEPLVIEQLADAPTQPATAQPAMEPIFVVASLEPLNTLGGSPAAPPGAPTPAGSGTAPADGTRAPDAQVLESIDAGFPAVRDTSNRPAEAVTLSVLNPIPDMSAGSEGFSFSVPHDAFIHTDAKAIVKLEARQAGGAALPGWLTFDGISGLLNGSLKSGDAMASLQLEIIARDEARREARSTFTIFGSGRSNGAELASSDSGFPALRLTFEQLGIVAAQRGTDILVRFRPVPDQHIGQGRLSFSIPADAFAHTNPRATIRLEARLANGDALPSWITFNGVTGRLTGAAPDGFSGVLQIHVTARDQQGLEASTEFTIEVGNLAATEDAAPQRSGEGASDGDEQQSIRTKPGDDRAAKQVAKRAAAGFADQLRAVRDVRPGSIDATLLDRALASKAAQRQTHAAAKS